MAGIRGERMSSAELRARRNIEKEQKRIDLKRRVNLMHSDGYTASQIADYFDLPEGSVRNMLSVNGGF